MDIRKWLAAAVIAGSIVALNATAATAAKPDPSCDDVFDSNDCDDSYNEVEERSGGKAGTSR